jgi:hypothetical protein
MSNIEDPIEDFLEVDQTIPGQQYCVLSFISPEKVLKQKDIYYNSEFLKWLCDQSEFLENVVMKGDKTRLNYSSIKEKYDDFIFTNEDRLENAFHELENFKTTVRGIKVRGVYSTQREAEVRCKVIQRLNKRDNVFLGQVGYWLPWDPSPDRVENTEYLEPELNKLMKQYKENACKRDIYYQEHKENLMKSRVQEKTREENTKDNTCSTEDNTDSASLDSTKNALFESNDPWLNRDKRD